MALPRRRSRFRRVASQRTPRPSPGRLTERPVVDVIANGSVEIKPKGVHKGLVIDQLLETNDSSSVADFVLAIGDDRSDEDMFVAVRVYAATAPLRRPCSVSTSTIGQKPSKAPAYLDDTDDVVDLLQTLAQYNVCHRHSGRPRTSRFCNTRSSGLHPRWIFPRSMMMMMTRDDGRSRRRMRRAMRATMCVLARVSHVRAPAPCVVASRACARRTWSSSWTSTSAHRHRFRRVGRRARAWTMTRVRRMRTVPMRPRARSLTR